MFDYKIPTGDAAILCRRSFGFRSFGIFKALFERIPWVSIKRHLENAKIQEYHFGLIFVASGEAN